MKGLLIYDRIGAERNSWFIEQIIEYSKSRSIEIECIISEKLHLAMIDSLPLPIYNGSPLSLPDFVINRCIDTFISEYFEKLNIRVFNSATVSRICNDKRKTHLFFSNKNIPMTDSIFLDRRFHTDVPSTDFPFVMKSSNGHGGDEVFMIKSAADYNRSLNVIKTDEFLIQKPVSNLGQDLRVYVLGGEILCSVLRSSDLDFRSNFSLGGRAAVYNLSQSELQLVKKIIEILPIDFGGIDFIFDGGGMMLNEVEDIVGSRMLYALTDILVHEKYIDHIYAQIEGG